MPTALPPVQLALLVKGVELYSWIIAVSLVCASLLTAFFMVNKRFVKTICACGIEVSIWLLVRALWGKECLAAQILCYTTAVAVIILTLAIVNRIDWSNLGPKKYQ